MTEGSPEEIFQNFNDLKVLIIGDVMIDSYLWGSVNRVSPEAPVPIVEVEEREKRLGGAANVAMNIGAMGATPILCSVIGEDQEAEDFLGLLKDLNFPQTGIVRSTTSKTTIKHRIIAGYQHILRVDSEDTSPINKEEQKLLIDRIKMLLPESDVVIFQDYDKGTITEELILEVMELSKASGKRVIVDPKKRNFLNYKKAYLFKPNLKELGEGLKVDIDKKDIESVKDAITDLKSRLEINNALITLSELGMIMSTEHEDFHLPAHKRSISDVSGAGDSVIAVAALGIALNLPLQTAAGLSNLAGGIVCEEIGVVPIDKSRLLEEAKSKAIL